MSCCSDSCGASSNSSDPHERRILIIVLLINAGMFFAEFAAGLVAGSTALLADSLDMLADALIYALGLFALGRAMHWRSRAALTSAVLQGLLGLLVGVQAIAHFFTPVLPDSALMLWFGSIALVANSICFILLTRFRYGDINLRATWLCSRNDMIGNIGVLLAAGLVVWLESPLPDVIIGLAIAGVVLYSAWGIGMEAFNDLSKGPSKGPSKGTE